jgi:hypothetical protein
MDNIDQLPPAPTPKKSKTDYYFEQDARQLATELNGNPEVGEHTNRCVESLLSLINNITSSQPQKKFFQARIENPQDSRTAREFSLRLEKDQTWLTFHFFNPDVPSGQESSIIVDFLQNPSGKKVINVNLAKHGIDSSWHIQLNNPSDSSQPPIQIFTKYDDQQSLTPKDLTQTLDKLPDLISNLFAEAKRQNKLVTKDTPDPLYTIGGRHISSAERKAPLN